MTRTLSIVVAAALTASAVCAQESRPVRLIVPVPPGGPTDFAARLIAPRLAEALGRNVIIDNRPSANGVVGSELGAHAAPDGNTLTLGNSGTHAINAGLYRKLPYDPDHDFIPVAGTLTSGLVLVANPRVPANSLADFIALAKKEPDRLNIGVAGATGQLAGEALKAQSQIALNNVLYKGSAPTEFAVLQGEVQVTFLTPIASANHVNAGKLKAFGVSSAKRISLLPNVPTIAELGVAGYDFQIWHGMFAPRGTPDKLVQKLNADVQHILDLPENRDKISAQGFEIMHYSPREFAVFVKGEMDKYRKLIQSAGIPQE